MAGCIQTISGYKTAAYKTAHLFAIELELDTVADLLQQIIDWEMETGKSMSSLSIKEFNRLSRSVQQ